MTDRLFRLSAALVCAMCLVSLPLAGTAQTSAYYTPPTLVTQGTATSPVLGVGDVTVQVFVKSDGSVGSVKVEKSTNSGDDTAALQIARSSVYKPGLRDGTPVDAFYTMRLTFGANAVTTDTGSGVNEVNAANALIRSSKYAEAKAALQTYLGAHPSDKDARALLGVAESYLGDADGAAAAFDAAGTIPDRFKVVAAKAYADAAVNALKARDNDRAIALADKSLAQQQTVNALFIRGTAYGNAQRYPQAIADLEKAKGLATAGSADAATLNAIDAGLATSYIFGGQPAKGLALAQALKRRDPSNTRVDDTLAAYYNQQAVAAMQAGNKAEAVADLENAAKMVPSRAVVLYVQAANVLAQGEKPDWTAVKAEVDKALAISPNDARANYVAGIALANAGSPKPALVYLQKAKANAGSDPSLNAEIDKAIASLSKT